MSRYLREQIHQRARELLADGEWHNYERVMEQLIPLVPAGIATRMSERNRAASTKRQDGRMKPMPLDEQIRSGARAVVRGVLNYERLYEATPSKARGSLTDPSRMIRLVPGAPQHRSMNPGPIAQLNEARARLREVEADNDALRAENDRLRQQVAELLSTRLIPRYHYVSDGMGGQCDGYSPSVGQRCQNTATATGKDGNRYCRRHIGQGGGLMMNADAQPPLPMPHEVNGGS